MQRLRCLSLLDSSYCRPPPHDARAGASFWGVEGAAGLGRAAAPESAQRYKRRRSYSKNGSIRRRIHQNDDLCHNRREIVRPACPIQRYIREKVRPARHKRRFWAIFRVQGELFRARIRTGPSRANFFAHRTRDMATLKPMTPLQPLMQASMKPPSPMLAPEQRPLKPPSPLQPINTPKTPSPHPQRRCRFQPHAHTSEQRR